MRPDADLAQQLASVRQHSVALVQQLSEADCQAQSMADASPAKWHLAHTTWFFETLVLERFEPGFQPHHPAYRALFNSYYNGIGEQHPRASRGLVTRPSLAEVLAYRAAVDQRLAALLAQAQAQAPVPALAPQALDLLTLGLHHEQQHQELLLTDLLHLFSCNPLAPSYLASSAAPACAEAGQTVRYPPALAWVASEGGLVEIGHAGEGFAFDNERPRHRHWLQPHALAQRLVTEGEWADFVADGGYSNPRWWLSAGWDWVRAQQLAAPIYWRPSAAGTGTGKGTGWQVFTLAGLRPLQPALPVAHVSAFEADAYTRWWSAQHPGQPPARLPTEAEWEHAARGLAAGAGGAGNATVPAPVGPPASAASPGPLQHMLGALWQWTSSAYGAYPGFAALDGAVGEYNAKFMVNQLVLRGGSFATPRGHLRTSYRNFFPAEARWQFSGLRLARSLT